MPHSPNPLLLPTRVYLLGEPTSLLVVPNTYPPLSLVSQQLPHPLLAPPLFHTPQFRLHYLHRWHQQLQSSSSGTTRCNTVGWWAVQLFIMSTTLVDCFCRYWNAESVTLAIRGILATTRYRWGCGVAVGMRRSSVVSTLDCWSPVPGSILTWWLLISSHPVTPPPPVQPRSRSYHSARSDPALDDSRDEYCIIKYI